MGVEAHNGHKRGKKLLSCGAPQSVILRLKQLHISPMPRAGVVGVTITNTIVCRLCHVMFNLIITAIDLLMCLRIHSNLLSQQTFLFM